MVPMRPTEYDSTKTATRKSGAPRIPAPWHAGGRALLLVFASLLGNAPTLQAQGSRTESAALVLHVVPEDHMEVQSDAIVLKIRLARGASARLWAADSCSSPSAESHVVSKSGTYNIPYAVLRMVATIPTDGSDRVCLESSDGTLRDSVPIGFRLTNDGAEVQAPQLVNVSGVWGTSIQKGTITVSNP